MSPLSDRQRLLLKIGNSQPRTSTEYADLLARQTGVILDDQQVRYTLRRLRSRGLMVSTDLPRPGKGGVPAHLYALTEAGLEMASFLRRYA